MGIDLRFILALSFLGSATFILLTMGLLIGVYGTSVVAESISRILELPITPQDLKVGGVLIAGGAVIGLGLSAFFYQKKCEEQREAQELWLYQLD